MAYENYKLFRDIAQTRSMSKAAAMNGISQSAATQQIQDLEKAFATELLDRSTRPRDFAATCCGGGKTSWRSWRG
jgi:DNA-binding transcriptional LysR family regulator